jgi:hypothetical protein
MINRSRIIASLCSMFNAYHGNDTTPAWVLELHHASTDGMLVARLQNWRENYPEQYAQHGLYVM